MSRKHYKVSVQVASKGPVYSPTGETKEGLDENKYNKSILDVSFDPDCKSNSRPVTAYANGLDCWWIRGD